MEENSGSKKQIGIFVATALVIGNMMGAGIFMIPAQLAQVGGPGASIFAWIITGVGSIILACTFANLGAKMPTSGGIVNYSKDAFGDFMGFMTGWLYWNGSWIGNATLFIVILSYIGQVITILSSNATVGFLFCSILLWGFTYINIRGAKFVGKISSVITVFKVLLFLFFMIIAAMNFNINNFKPLFPINKGIEKIPLTAAITLWAFIGLETASVTSGEIKNPEKNVKKSTILGIAISAILYLGISCLAIGAMSQNDLAQSNAPLTDITKFFLGSNIINYFNIGIGVCVCGTALGWLLSTAKVAYAAGQLGLFPKIFSKKHPKYDTPHIALIISAILVNLIFLLNFIQGLSSLYNFIVLLSTLSYLPIYAWATISEILLTIKDKKNITIFKFFKFSFRSLIGFLFAVWCIYAAGAEVVLYGFILIMLGVPFYAYVSLKNAKNN